MTLTVGFLGAGFIARLHAGFLAGSGEEHRIGPVFDPDQARAQAFTADHGGQVVPEEAVAVDQADVVYICTWTSERPRLVDLVVEAGKPMLCEKPLGVDLATAQMVHDRIMASGLVHQVGLVLRDTPPLRLLRHRARQREAGRQMALVLRDDQYLPVGRRYGSTWRADVARAGSGTLLEHSIHDVDLLEWIAGPAVSVCARTGYFHAIDGIEDQAVCLLSHASGAVSTLVSVWHDIETRPGNRHLEVICERETVWLNDEWFGPLQWDGEAGSGRVDPADVYASATEVDGRSGNADAEFLRCVRRGEPATPDAAAALRAHVLVDAAYRSAATGGTPVDVAP